MEAEIQQATDNLTTFKSSLEDLNKVLAPVLAEVEQDVAKGDDADRAASTALERARRHIALSYASVSLFTMYLRLQGLTVGDHAVQHDIVRVQDAFMRLRRVEAHAPNAGEHVPKARNKRTISAREAANLALCNTVFPMEAELVRSIWGGFDRRDGEPEHEAEARMRKRRKRDGKKEKRARKIEAEKAQRHARRQAAQAAQAQGGANANGGGGDNGSGGGSNATGQADRAKQGKAPLKPATDDRSAA